MRKHIALIMAAALLLPMIVMPGQGQGRRRNETRERESQAQQEREQQERKSQTSSNVVESKAGEVDADAGRFGRDGLSFKDYLRLREGQVGLLRGDQDILNGSSNPRVTAIRQLEQQVETQRQQNASKYGANSAQTTNAPQINSTSWTQVGPMPIPRGQTTSVRNPVSGRVLSIDVHPTNPNIAYVGTSQGGLYRTLDGGQTWVALMDDALSLSIGAVAIDPLNPSTVFVGTGEGNFCGGCYFGVGLYIIKNADTKPILTGPFDNATNTANGKAFNSRSITKIVVDPNDDNIIFVGTGSGLAGVGNDVGLNLTPRGLYRSTNAMSASPTFTKMSVNGPNGGLNTAARDIAFEPGNPNNLLVGIADTLGAATTTTGVWRTTNALAANPSSVTFTQTYATPVSESGFNVQLAINKNGNTVTVYVALDENDPDQTAGQGGVIKKSTDGGLTWSAALSTASGFCGTQCFYDAPIAVDPTNPNKVYAGGSGDYDSFQTPFTKSTDGTTFAKSSTGLHPDAHAIKIAPSNASVIYAGNDGGIFRTNDNAANWTSLNNSGFSATQFTSLATHPTDRNFMIGGTQDNGTPFLQADNTWKLGDFGDGGFAIIDQNATDTTTVTAYHTYYNASPTQIGFVRADSSDQIDPDTGWPTFYGCAVGGIPNGINCSDSVLFYAPMAQGPGNPNTLYFGTDKIYRSINKGVAMTAVSQTFVPPNPPTTTASTPVSAIGISPQNDNVRIAGTVNGKVFATSTGLPVMTDVTGPIPAKYIARAVVDPTNASIAYVTLGGFGLAAGQHIWKTTNLADAGTTWTASGNGIPDIPVNSFAVDPSNHNQLFAGTDIGVYRSVDGGANWTPFTDGLPRVAIFDLKFQGQGTNQRILRAATYGRGIWQISLKPAIKPRADFDTDGKSDVSIWQGNSTGNWIINNSTGFTRIERNWGNTSLGDIAVPRDYDGDNKLDIAVFRPSEGNWYIIMSSRSALSSNVVTRNWGGTGDVPVPGDYDGDGKDDLAVFRPSEGNWYIINSSNGAGTVKGWGASNDLLVPADYDNDGKTDIAVFRPSEGNWYIINSGSNTATVRSWGISGDKPAPADYDGDGKDDLAVFRPSEGNWYIIQSSNGAGVLKNWGAATDVPVPADYDGDGRADIAIYRPAEGNWYILKSTGGVSLQHLGNSNDVPVPATYLPR